MEISDDFPNDILLEILVKLPIQSLFKFKCVSKNWLSLISHSSFLPHFISRSEDSPPFMLIFQMHCYKEALGFVCVGNNIFKKTSSLAPNRTAGLRIASTSNDLILYQSINVHDQADFLVANPLTRQFVRHPLRRNLGCSKTGLISYVRNGTTSYNIVLVTKYHDKTSPCLNIEILSSERDKCRCSEMGLDFGVEFDARPCIEFKGVLYWICNKMTALFSYDPCSSSDQFRLISIPNEIYLMSGKNAVLGTSCGDLYYFEMSRICMERSKLKLPRWKLWLLRDHKRGEWRLDREGKEREMESSFGGVCSVLLTYGLLLPIALHPWKKHVVYFWYEGYVLTFDADRGWFEDEYFSTTSSLEGVVAAWEVFPLLMPFCPTQIPKIRT